MSTSKSTQIRPRVPDDDKAYIMLHGKPVLIDEIYTVESAFLRRCYSFKGVIPVNIKSRSLELALHFCKERAEVRNKYAGSILDTYLRSFDINFLMQVVIEIDAVDLIHAAGRLDIKSLFDLLFEPVVGMISSKTPEEIRKIFKVRYNGDHQRLVLINYVLDCAPPIPPVDEEKMIKFNQLQQKQPAKTKLNNFDYVLEELKLKHDYLKEEQTFAEIVKLIPSKKPPYDQEEKTTKFDGEKDILELSPADSKNPPYEEEKTTKFDDEEILELSPAAAAAKNPPNEEEKVKLDREEILQMSPADSKNTPYEELEKFDREKILQVSPAGFKNLPDPQKMYWVYAHLVIKRKMMMKLGDPDQAKSTETWGFDAW